LVITQGALAAALELSKQRAVAGNADARRSEWLNDLLTGVVDDAILARQCRAWGYDLEVRATLLLLSRVSPPDTPPDSGGDRTRERWASVISSELARRRTRGLVISRDDRLSVVVPTLESSRDSTGQNLATALTEVLTAQSPQAGLAARAFWFSARLASPP